MLTPEQPWPWNIPAPAHADTQDQIAKDAEIFQSQYDDGWEFLDDDLGDDYEFEE